MWRHCNRPWNQRQCSMFDTAIYMVACYHWLLLTSIFVTNKVYLNATLRHFVQHVPHIAINYNLRHITSVVSFMAPFHVGIKTTSMPLTSVRCLIIPIWWPPSFRHRLHIIITLSCPVPGSSWHIHHEIEDNAWPSSSAVEQRPSWRLSKTPLRSCDITQCTD